MLLKQFRPTFSKEFAACARASRFDVASSVILFISASLGAGRAWRFPFDDELIALMPIERSHSAFELLIYYLQGADIHPPLSFLLFYGLQHLGFGEPAMRLCSIAMTAITLALFQLIALTLIARRTRGGISLTTRLITVLLFSLCPLAIGQGDAIRWYPLFAMLFSLFVTLYLFGGNRAAQFCSAIALGLAASTNFLATIVFVPFALYRYILQRQFRALFDVTYGFLVLLFASIGIVTAYSLITKRFAGVMHTEFGHSVVQATLSNVLGFFGGDALGIGQAWLVVPAVVVTGFALFSEMDRKRPTNPANLFLLLLAAAALVVLAGFAKPRSFLYLAPVVAVLLTLYVDRQVRRGQTGIVVLLAALILAPSIGTTANINFGTHPFKRNAVIPYQSIVDFIATNETGSVLVVSTDPVVPWILRHQHDRKDHCVSYFLTGDGCLGAGRHYDSIFVIAGHNNTSENAAFGRSFDSDLEKLVAGRRKVATIHAGVDKDAGLKSRLTGVPLDEYILAVEFYQ
jgi:hypothetical protein